MRKGGEPSAHQINFVLNVNLKGWRHTEEVVVKLARRNLGGRAVREQPLRLSHPHPPLAKVPFTEFDFRFELVGKLQFVLENVLQPVAQDLLLCFG